MKAIIIAIVASLMVCTLSASTDLLKHKDFNLSYTNDELSLEMRQSYIQNAKFSITVFSSMLELEKISRESDSIEGIVTIWMKYSF